jgi:hypothetical protein
VKCILEAVLGGDRNLGNCAGLGQIRRVIVHATVSENGCIIGALWNRTPGPERLRGKALLLEGPGASDGMKVFRCVRTRQRATNSSRPCKRSSQSPERRLPITHQARGLLPCPQGISLTQGGKVCTPACR